MTITPVLDEGRSISGFIAIKSDVTERERSRASLEASLAEKEVLLREIHHRINNNMQLITSLLNLSSQKIADPSLREILDDVSRRVVSMALVHEQFYNSGDMARIDFLLYLRQLIDGIGDDFRRSSGEISVASREETILLNLEQAIPAGLIASELIANALKHAYPVPSAPGRIRVSLRRLGERIELSVGDDGVGLPVDLVVESAESLGMILIRTLATQLGGEVEFTVGNGTEAVVRFPVMT
jgi:two-component sensor histidine kinase